MLLKDYLEDLKTLKEILIDSTHQYECFAVADLVPKSSPSTSAMNILNSSVDYNPFSMVSHHHTDTTTSTSPNLATACYLPPPPQQPHSPRLSTPTSNHLNQPQVQQQLQFMPPTCSQELKPVITYSDTTQSFNSFITDSQPTPPIFTDHSQHPVTVSQSQYIQEPPITSQLTSLGHIKQESGNGSILAAHCNGNGGEFYNQAISFSSKTPPVSPINMEEQEKFKLERKRMRNREAASKCRRRKLEKISKLEQRVGELRIENNTLSKQLNQLKEHVCSLKQEVIEHMQSGCPIVPPDQSLLCF